METGQIQAPTVERSRFVPVAQQHTSIAQVVITTTEDRVRLAMEHELQAAAGRNEWVAPAGILIAIITTLLTTNEFEDALGVSKATWEAIYIVSGFVILYWLVRAIYRAWKCPSPSELTNRVIAELKQEQP